MKKFILEQSDSDIFTPHSGLALVVGACVNKHTSLAATLVRTCGNAGRISDLDVLMSYLGLLCLGKSDFDAITGRSNDNFFRHALGLDAVPSSETLRRWVVEVTHSWFNRFRKLLVRYEKLTATYEALLHMAAAIIAFRKTGIIYG